jgi:hypothetical protein
MAEMAVRPLESGVPPSGGCSNPRATRLRNREDGRPFAVARVGFHRQRDGVHEGVDAPETRFFQKLIREHAW